MTIVCDSCKKHCPYELATRISYPLASISEPLEHYVCLECSQLLKSYITHSMLNKHTIRWPEVKTELTRLGLKIVDTKSGEEVTFFEINKEVK